MAERRPGSVVRARANQGAGELSKATGPAARVGGVHQQQDKVSVEQVTTSCQFLFMLMIEPLLLINSVHTVI